MGYDRANLLEFVGIRAFYHLGKKNIQMKKEYTNYSLTLLLIPISTNLYMLISYLEYQQVASGINKHMMKTEDRPSNELASTTKTTQKQHQRDIKY